MGVDRRNERWRDEQLHLAAAHHHDVVAKTHDTAAEARALVGDLEGVAREEALAREARDKAERARGHARQAGADLIRT